MNISPDSGCKKFPKRIFLNDVKPLDPLGMKISMRIPIEQLFFDYEKYRLRFADKVISFMEQFTSNSLKEGFSSYDETDDVNRSLLAYQKSPRKNEALEGKMEGTKGTVVNRSEFNTNSEPIPRQFVDVELSLDHPFFWAEGFERTERLKELQRKGLFPQLRDVEITNRRNPWDCEELLNEEDLLRPIPSYFSTLCNELLPGERLKFNKEIMLGAIRSQLSDIRIVIREEDFERNQVWLPKRIFIISRNGIGIDFFLQLVHVKGSLGFEGKWIFFINGNISSDGPEYYPLRPCEYCCYLEVTKGRICVEGTFPVQSYFSSLEKVQRSGGGLVISDEKMRSIVDMGEGGGGCDVWLTIFITRMDDPLEAEEFGFVPCSPFPNEPIWDRVNNREYYGCLQYWGLYHSPCGPFEEKRFNAERTVSFRRFCELAVLKAIVDSAFLYFEIEG